MSFKPSESVVEADFHSLKKMSWRSPMSGKSYERVLISIYPYHVLASAIVVLLKAYIQM